MTHTPASLRDNFRLRIGTNRFPFHKSRMCHVQRCLYFGNAPPLTVVVIGGVPLVLQIDKYARYAVGRQEGWVVDGRASPATRAAGTARTLASLTRE
jgi:hypothetical protein